MGKSKKDLKAELKLALDKVEELTSTIEADDNHEETAEEAVIRLEAKIKELEANKEVKAKQANLYKAPATRTAEEAKAVKAKAKKLLNN